MTHNNKTDQEIKKEIGKNISRIRRSSRSYITAEKVSKKLYIARSTLTQIENGRNNVNAVMLWKLSCILDCEVSDFFPDTPQGFGLSSKDVEEVKKQGDLVVDWAKDLFGSQTE